MKKRILSLLLLCMLALSFATAQGSKKIELTFFYPVQVGGPLTKLIEKICADFTAENPNIVVKPVYTGNYDDTVVKIQTARSGKNPPFLPGAGRRTAYQAHRENLRRLYRRESEYRGEASVHGQL